MSNGLALSGDPMSDSDPADAQLHALILRVGSRWVVWLLVVLSFAALAMIFERTGPRR
jgi:hypothetical protein